MWLTPRPSGAEAESGSMRAATPLAGLELKIHSLIQRPLPNRSQIVQCTLCFTTAISTCLKQEERFQPHFIALRIRVEHSMIARLSGSLQLQCP